MASRLLGTMSEGFEREGGGWRVKTKDGTTIEDHTILFKLKDTKAGKIAVDFSFETQGNGARTYGQIEAVSKPFEPAVDFQMAVIATNVVFRHLNNTLIRHYKRTDINLTEKDKGTPLKAVLAAITSQLASKDEYKHYVIELGITDLQLQNLVLYKLRGRDVKENPQVTVTLDLRLIADFFNSPSEVMKEGYTSTPSRRMRIMKDAYDDANEIIPSIEGIGTRKADKLRGYLTLVAQCMRVINLDLRNSHGDDESTRAYALHGIGDTKADEKKRVYFKRTRVGNLSKDSVPFKTTYYKDYFGLIHKTPLAVVFWLGLGRKDHRMIQTVKNAKLLRDWAMAIALEGTTIASSSDKHYFDLNSYDYEKHPSYSKESRTIGAYINDWLFPTGSKPADLEKRADYYWCCVIGDYGSHPIRKQFDQAKKLHGFEPRIRCAFEFRALKKRAETPIFKAIYFWEKAAYKVYMERHNGKKDMSPPPAQPDTAIITPVETEKSETDTDLGSSSGSSDTGSSPTVD